MNPVNPKTRMPASGLPGRRTRVVIVEDNQAVADIVRHLLELHGYEVRVAYTGPEGMRLAQEWSPEVVLCDLGLPGLDGYGVAAALRRHPATAQARLLALTGEDSDADRQRSQAVGFERYLVKPRDLKVLLEVLAGR
jgi:CheY-like chemotaxis protein